MVFRAENSEDLAHAWLLYVSRAEFADYVYDLLLGAEGMARIKGFNVLAGLIAAAASEAHAHTGEDRCH
jgi:hypothetical protein